MRFIVQKELRELAPVLGLVLTGMLVLGAVLASQTGHYPVEAYLWAAICAGTLVGAFQSWLDHRAEDDPFLRHRALSATAVRSARTLAGAVALVVAVLTPWLALWVVPGRAGLQYWTHVDPQTDLAFSHALPALGFAALFWSLARLSGSVRTWWLRPIAGALLGLAGVLASLGRDNATTVAVLVLGTLLATAAIVWPARETHGRGARRLLRPAAVVGLLCLVLPWLEISMWTRMPVSSGLLGRVQVLADDEGEVRLHRSRYLGNNEGTHLLETDAHDDRVLRDEIVTGSYRFGGVLLGNPGRGRSWLLGRFVVGNLWEPPDFPWAGGERLENLALKTVLDRRLTRTTYRDGRIVWTRDHELHESVFGSVGPDGWSDGAPPADAPRFSPRAFLAAKHGEYSTANHHLLVVDPAHRVVVSNFCRDDTKSREDAVIEARVVAVPAAIEGELMDFFSTTHWRMNYGDQGTVALRTAESLLLVRIEDEVWEQLPLAPDETVAFHYGGLRYDRPMYAVSRPPYLDTSLAVRVRAQPKDGEGLVTTDFVLAPRRGLERVSTGILGAISTLRPPILNAVSFATSAPETRDALAGRWFRDGIVSGGAGGRWLLGSLLLGLLCAVFARRQARRRCDGVGDVNAWTVLAFLLGPLGLLWMRMLVRKSALREAPDGRTLAVHIDASWPLPAPTGREVILHDTP